MLYLLAETGVARASDDKVLWWVGCLDRRADNKMTAGVLFPPLCTGTVCSVR